MIALLLATLVVAKEPPARAAAPGAEPAARSPAPPLSEEDQAVLENLELLEQLDLLSDLPIVEPGDEPEPVEERKAKKGK